MQARLAIRLDESTSTDLRSRSSSLSDGRLPSAVSRRSQAGGLSTVSLTARSRRSRRQLFAGLRAHHVLGVPLRPVRILLPRSSCLPCASAASRRACSRSLAESNVVAITDLLSIRPRRRRPGRQCFLPARKPLLDLLKQPAVAVGVLERCEGAVRAAVG